MNAQELKRFTQDIRGDGLREPLILDEKDRVIDGRNRVTTLTLL
jgi:ParB-like chromosome segregation protein Spo0J